MDLPSNVMALSGIAKTAKHSRLVGATLLSYVRRNNLSEGAVSDLATKLNDLANTCDTGRSQLEEFAKQDERRLPSRRRNDAYQQEQRLWTCIQKELDACESLVQHLDRSVECVWPTEPSDIAQSGQEIRLNIANEEIVESKTKLAGLIADLQMTLLAIEVNILCTNPQKSPPDFPEMVVTLQRCISNKADRGSSGDGLIQVMQEIVSTSKCQMDSSLSSGSEISASSPDRERDQVSDWIRELEDLRVDSVRPQTGSEDSNVPSIFSIPADQETSITEVTSASGSLAIFDNQVDHSDSDDDFDVEVAKQALESGREAFEKQDWREANVMLQEALHLTQGLSYKYRASCDIYDLHYRLTVCAYHTQRPEAAETALLGFTKMIPKSEAHKKELCSAGHLLAQTYVRVGKLDLARLTCESVLKGKRTLLGKQNPSYHESLALMSRICELDKRSGQAMVYLKMIPQDSVVALKETFSHLNSQNDVAAASRHDSPQQGGEQLHPSERSRPVSPTTPGLQPDHGLGLGLRHELSAESSPTTISKPPLTRAPVSAPAGPLHSPTLSEGRPVTRQSTSSTAPRNFSPRPTGIPWPLNPVSRQRWIEQLSINTSGDLSKAIIANDEIRVANLLFKMHHGPQKGAGVTAMHLAALFGDTKLAADLVRGGVNLTASCTLAIDGARATDKVTPLHFAIGARHESMIKFLVERGVSLHGDKSKSSAPAAYLLWSNWLDATDCGDVREVINILRTLIGLGWDINSPIWHTQWSMLHFATYLPQDKLETRDTVVRFLLGAGARVDNPSIDGRIPLHMAANNNSTPETVCLLLARNAEIINKGDKAGDTALHGAVRHRALNQSSVSLEIIQALCEAGAKPGARNKDGKTALSIADFYKDKEAALVLRNYFTEEIDVKSLRSTSTSSRRLSGYAAERSRSFASSFSRKASIQGTSSSRIYE